MKWGPDWDRDQDLAPVRDRDLYRGPPAFIIIPNVINIILKETRIGNRIRSRTGPGIRSRNRTETGTKPGSRTRPGS